MLRFRAWMLLLRLSSLLATGFVLRKCAVLIDRFSGGTPLSLGRAWFARHALRKLRDVAPNAAQELSRTKKPGCLALKTSDALACRFCGGCGGLLLLTRPGSRLPGALAAVRVPDALRQSLLERLTRCVFQNFLQEFADDSAGLRWRIAERIHIRVHQNLHHHVLQCSL